MSPSSGPAFRGLSIIMLPYRIRGPPEIDLVASVTARSLPSVR